MRSPYARMHRATFINFANAKKRDKEYALVTRGTKRQQYDCCAKIRNHTTSARCTLVILRNLFFSLGWLEVAFKDIDACNTIRLEFSL